MATQFKYLDKIFIIQAYREYDFLNICEVNGDFFSIDLIDKKITTSGKETTEWKRIAKKINIDEIAKIVKIHLSFKMIPSKTLNPQ
jgi:hypothetical protein